MNLLSMREAASQLGFAPKPMRKLIRAGPLRGVRIGRKWRVDQDDLDLFVVRRRTI
jgi:excisionase family DNA binding protein